MADNEQSNFFKASSEADFAMLEDYEQVIHSNPHEIHTYFAIEKILYHETYVSQGLWNNLGLWIN